MSDFQDNPDCGALMGLVGGSYGTALFETTIKRITFAGPPIQWQFDTILSSHGCMAEGSVTGHLNFVWYLSNAGFMQFDGNSVTPIGAEQVDRYFFNSVNMANLSSMRVAVDPRTHTVMWVYSSGAQGTANDLAIIYNYVLQKWSHGEVPAAALGSMAQPGYTLDELDIITTHLDALPASLDSRVWAGGAGLFLGAMGYDGRLHTFVGPPNTAIIETRQLPLSPGSQRSMLVAIYPVIEGDQTAIRAQIYSKGRSQNEWREGPILTENPAGGIATRREGRYHRIRVLIDGYWTHALAVEYLANPLGIR